MADWLRSGSALLALIAAAVFFALVSLAALWRIRAELRAISRLLEQMTMETRDNVARLLHTAEGRIHSLTPVRGHLSDSSDQREKASEVSETQDLR